MIVDVVKIGNSKGLRIPSVILKQCQIGDKLDLTFEDGKIVLRPINAPRKDWREAFKSMNKNGDDLPIIDDTIDVSEDWEWK
jgi:antitoxin MazE